jgi:HEAT repeat protein
MLQLAQAVPQERIAAQLRRVLESDAERETLVAALKLLADPRDAPLARRYAAHGEWVVRLAAVRALGRIATKPDLPVLCGALADPVWWVRQRAADAIVGLPYLTASQLKLLQTIVADRFGADALARALAAKKLS